jgi:hypothetical protein
MHGHFVKTYLEASIDFMPVISKHRLELIAAA